MKKQSAALSILGLALLLLLSIGNLAHLIFTVWLTVEQVGSSWGAGTAMEMGVLYPWMIEVICAPVLVAGAVYFILHTVRSSRKRMLISNVVLYFALILQYALTNLFIWF